MAIKDEVKSHGISALVLTWLPLIPVFMFIGKPLIVDALAEDLTSSVQQQIAPVKSAFITLIDREIRDLTFQVSKMEFAKVNDEEWNAFNEQELTNLKLALSEAKEAKQELKGEV